MDITLQPVDNTERMTQAVTWLRRLLESPTYGGVEKPAIIVGYLYIDNIPHLLETGSWQIGDGHIYCARNSSSVEPLTRLAILATIAHITGAIHNADIRNTLVTRISHEIANSTRTVFRGILQTPDPVSRIAIDQENLQVAAEIGGRWISPAGIPMEVKESWITMNF